MEKFTKEELDLFLRILSTVRIDPAAQDFMHTATALERLKHKFFALTEFVPPASQNNSENKPS